MLCGVIPPDRESEALTIAFFENWFQCVCTPKSVQLSKTVTCWHSWCNEFSEWFRLPSELQKYQHPPITHILQKVTLMNLNPTGPLKLLLTCVTVLTALVQCQAADPIEIATRSKAETSIAASSQQEKYSFIMFWKKQDAATNTMWKNLQSGLLARSDQAASLAVRVTDPTEMAVVKQYGVSRAPMPLLLAVAPNGAVTASYAKELDVTKIDNAFVTPTMTRCMLAMQNRKLVLLCVHGDEQAVPPQGVAEFQSVPCFQKTAEIVHMNVNDPSEARFLGELEIPRETRGTTTVFMAPPGVMLGKYPANVTKEQLIKKLNDAGKGCGDKNCKHCKP